MTNNEMLGNKIIEIFCLKRLSLLSKERGQNYYHTTWGTKTSEGIGATIKRLVKESEENI